jgi:hypothetical protein
MTTVHVHPDERQRREAHTKQKDVPPLVAHCQCGIIACTDVGDVHLLGTCAGFLCFWFPLTHAHKASDRKDQTATWKTRDTGIVRELVSDNIVIVCRLAQTPLIAM